MKWNLSDLYKNINDKKIENDIKKLKKQALSFEKKYKNKINEKIKDEYLFEAISEFEDILMNAQKPYNFASLLFSVDSSNIKLSAFIQKMEEEYIKITSPVLFFELELGKLTNKKIKDLIKSEKLKKYSHYLDHIFKTKKHNLSEKEEKIIQTLSPLGKSSFMKMFEQIHAKRKFKLKLGKEIKELSQPEVLSLLYSKKRSLRKEASEALSCGLFEDSFYITFIYNNVLNTRKTFDELRRYKYPEESRHIVEETEKEVVDIITKVISKKYSLVSRYYKLKKKALKLPELYDYDRYAPLPKKEKEVEFKEAQALVLESFSEFSKDFSELAKKFFDKKWIDSEPKKGKSGGAYCSYVTPDLHPYVFLNYNKNYKDVLTLAHELGHGVHALMSQDKGYLNFDPSLALAETASVFAEMLVFDKELKKIKNEKEKFAFLSSKIEDIFASTFRQACMYQFEKEIHKKSREKGELSTKEISEIWMKNNKKMFGNSVKLTENYNIWWSYVSHFFHSPFYVYTYVFGELLTLALYEEYKKDKNSFKERYLKLLSAGGSDTPKNLLKKIMKIDITKEEFWLSGIKVIENMIKEAEKSYKK